MESQPGVLISKRFVVIRELTAYSGSKIKALVQYSLIKSKLLLQILFHIKFCNCDLALVNFRNLKNNPLSLKSVPPDVFSGLQSLKEM